MKVNPKVALFALAIGAFAIGTTEFTPMGLLPVIADGVHVSIPKAGMLISAYAIGVMVGAPLMTLLLARWSRRSVLIAIEDARAAAAQLVEARAAELRSSSAYAEFIGLSESFYQASQAAVGVREELRELNAELEHKVTTRVQELTPKLWKQRFAADLLRSPLHLIGK